jgi:hypothetical protein
MKRIFFYTILMLSSIISITGCDKENEEEVIALTDITVEPPIINLLVGGEQKVTATPVPANATGVTFTWNSQDVNVATVDQSGLVTVIGVGTTTVTVSSGSISKNITVGGVISSITVKDAEGNTSGDYIVGAEPVQLTATIDPAGASITATWQSSNELVATVSTTGLVTITGVGIDTISAIVGNVKADYILSVSSPVAGLTQIQEFSDNDSPYTVTLYNETGHLRFGYTKVYFAVTDENGKFISNATLSAFPEMDMGMSKHSTPHSEITKVEGKALYEAYYSFIMYSGQMNGTWYYDLTYTVGDVSHSFDNVVIQVDNASAPIVKGVQSILAIDGSDKRYVVTLVEPQHPKVGLQEITAYVHHRVDNNTFNGVGNFTLIITPWMSSMGHGSNNNVNLTWDADRNIYRGTVNFGMAGDWRVYLQLKDENGTTLFGNSDNTSTLYFDFLF